jgi:hypothetical protein
MKFSSVSVVPKYLTMKKLACPKKGKKKRKQQQQPALVLKNQPYWSKIGHWQPPTHLPLPNQYPSSSGNLWMTYRIWVQDILSIL